MRKRSAWKEKDPIQTVMDQTGMSRLDVLVGLRDAMVQRHSVELARNPKAPNAMRNLEAAIAEERKRVSHSQG